MKFSITAFLISVSLLLAIPLVGQIEDGSFVQNFKGIDTEGNEHELFDLLSSGYKVIIDVSATWCDPCWDYKRSGALEDLHRQYGPDGTQEIFVLMIESDDSNSAEDLDGSGTYTLGDWITDTPYPIIDNGSRIASLLEILYLPSIFTVCSDGRVYESGQLSTEEHYDFAMAMNCQAVANDLAVQETLAKNTYCVSPIDPQIVLINVGTDTLKEVTITMEACDACPLVIEWTGSLAYFESELIVFPSVEINSEEFTLVFDIESPDNNIDNNLAIVNVNVGNSPATSQCFIEFVTDCYPNENQWEILDSKGELIENRLVFTEPNSVYRDTVELLEDECYTFNFRDYRADGLNGSANGACLLDGFFRVWSEKGLILDVGGTSHFQLASQNIKIEPTVLSLEDFAAPNIIISPNPTSGIIYLNLEDTQSQIAELVVYNVEGKILEKDMFIELNQFNQGQLDLSSFNPGLYFIKVKTNKLEFIRKVVVE